MDAKQWALTLLLLRLFEPSVFDNHCTTRYVHHHCDSHCYHVTFLFVDVLQTNLEHILITIDSF